MDILVDRRPAVLAGTESDGGAPTFGEANGVVEGVLAIEGRCLLEDALITAAERGRWVCSLVLFQRSVNEQRAGSAAAQVSMTRWMSAITLCGVMPGKMPTTANTPWQISGVNCISRGTPPFMRTIETIGGVPLRLKTS